jgi:hypothetical protein
LLLIALSLTALALLPRWAFLDNPFIRDDYALAAQNPSVFHPAPAARIFSDPDTYSSLPSFNTAFYRPLHVWTLSLDVWWSGVSPRSFRRTNLLLHAFTVVIFFFMTRRLLAIFSPETNPNLRNRVALTTAAVLAVHPLSTIATDYISNRSLTLATLLGTASLWSFLDKRGGWRHVRTLGFLAAAMMSKESCATLPVVFLAVERLRPSPKNRWKAGKRIISALAVVAFFLLLRFPLGLGQTQLNHSVALGERLNYMAGQVVVLFEVYLPGFFWPRLVRWEPSFRQVTTASPVFWLAGSLGLLLVGALWKKRHRHPILAFSALAALLPLLPTTLIPQPIPAMYYRCYPGSGFLYLALLWSLRRFWPPRLGQLSMATLILVLASQTAQMVSTASTHAGLWEYATAYELSIRGQESFANSRPTTQERLRLLNRLLKKHPRALRSFIARARAHLLLGAAEAAKQDLLVAQKTLTEHTSIAFLLGVIRTLQAPDSPPAKKWSFSAAYAAGFARKALAEGNILLARAVAQTAQLEQQPGWFCPFIAGEISIAEKNYSQAVALLRLSILRGGPPREVSKHLAWALAAKGKCQEVRELVAHYGFSTEEVGTCP